MTLWWGPFNEKELKSSKRVIKFFSLAPRLNVWMSKASSHTLSFAHEYIWLLKWNYLFNRFLVFRMWMLIFSDFAVWLWTMTIFSHPLDQWAWTVIIMEVAWNVYWQLSSIQARNSDVISSARFCPAQSWDR